jgi:hypothetical protein
MGGSLAGKNLCCCSARGNWNPIVKHKINNLDTTLTAALVVMMEITLNDCNDGQGSEWDSLIA